MLFGSASGSKDLAELLARGKQKGVSIANADSGSLGHLAGELLQLRAATPIINVPYKGSGLAINEMIAGQVDATFTSTASGMPQVKNGRLRALAIASPTPSQEYPEIPTFAQLGIQCVNVLNWWGIVGSADMAPEVVEKISQVLKAAVQSPEMRQRFAALGITPSLRPSREFSALIRSELTQWKSVVREARIKIEQRHCRSGQRKKPLHRHVRGIDNAFLTAWRPRFNFCGNSCMTGMHP